LQKTKRMSNSKEPGTNYIGFFRNLHSHAPVLPKIIPQAEYFEINGHFRHPYAMTHFVELLCVIYIIMKFRNVINTTY
jgi:hypothetical protein